MGAARFWYWDRWATRNLSATKTQTYELHHTTEVAHRFVRMIAIHGRPFFLCVISRDTVFSIVCSKSYRRPSAKPCVYSSTLRHPINTTAGEWNSHCFGLISCSNVFVFFLVFFYFLFFRGNWKPRNQSPLWFGQVGAPSLLVSWFFFLGGGGGSSPCFPLKEKAYRKNQRN